MGGPGPTPRFRRREKVISKHFRKFRDHSENGLLFASRRFRRSARAGGDGGRLFHLWRQDNTRNGPMDGDEQEKRKTDPEASEDAAFPIRDFLDLRRLRRTYLRCGDRPTAVDSSSNPIPEDGEDDFGLKRSTEEEALEFLRESLAGDSGDDPLTEFLDDE